MQKALVRHIWTEASRAAAAARTTVVTPDHLQPVIDRIVRTTEAPDGATRVHFDGREPLEISPVRARQMMTLAFSLRAVLAVQQDSLFDAPGTLMPLDEPSIDRLRRAVDTVTGLGGIYLFIFAVLGLGEHFTEHEYVGWALDIGFFVTLVGYMAWRGIDQTALKESVYLTARTTAMVPAELCHAPKRLRASRRWDRISLRSGAAVAGSKICNSSIAAAVASSRPPAALNQDGSQ